MRSEPKVGKACACRPSMNAATTASPRRSPHPGRRARGCEPGTRLRTVTRRGRRGVRSSPPRYVARPVSRGLAPRSWRGPTTCPSRPPCSSGSCARSIRAPRTAEAARRAVWLAGPATELIFVAPGEAGDEERAGAVLDSATRLAAERGIAAAAHRLTSRNVPEDVIEASTGADLLVVDAGELEVWIGGVASAAVHAAPLPVLVARPAADADRSPELVLVATDGSPDSRSGVELAARIAGASAPGSDAFGRWTARGSRAIGRGRRHPRPAARRRACGVRGPRQPRLGDCRGRGANGHR